MQEKENVVMLILDCQAARDLVAMWSSIGSDSVIGSVAADARDHQLKRRGFVTI